MEIHGSLIKTSYFQLFLHCCHNTSQFSPEGRQALIQICGVSQVITSTPEFSSYRQFQPQLSLLAEADG